MPKVSIAQLRQIEWAGTIYSYKCCPICYGLMIDEDGVIALSATAPWPCCPIPAGTSLPYGHNESCWLGNLLRVNGKGIWLDKGEEQ